MESGVEGIHRQAEGPLAAGGGCAIQGGQHLRPDAARPVFGQDGYRDLGQWVARVTARERVRLEATPSSAESLSVAPRDHTHVTRTAPIHRPPRDVGHVGRALGRRPRRKRGQQCHLGEERQIGNGYRAELHALIHHSHRASAFRGLYGERS